MSTVTETARRRDPDARPQQILDAALAVFGEEGLAGARLDDIARRAGIAKGTIYLYFANKEELFREVVRSTIVRRLEEQEAHFAAAAPDTSAETQLRCYMSTWWEFLLTPAFQTVYRLVVGEVPRFPDLFEFHLREVAGRSKRLLGGVVARGQARGEFRTDLGATEAARMISALFISHALWAGNSTLPRVEADGALTPDAVLAQIEAFVLHALLPREAARPGTPRS